MPGEVILDQNVRGILCMEGIFELRLEWRRRFSEQQGGKGPPCGGISKCKGPGAETNLMCLNRKMRQPESSEGRKSGRGI